MKLFFNVLFYGSFEIWGCFFITNKNVKGALHKELFILVLEIKPNNLIRNKGQEIDFTNEKRFLSKLIPCVLFFQQ